MTISKPALRPVNPHFSSGPCAKSPGWTPQQLADALVGRSHRAEAGKARLKRAIDLTREVLQVPADYRIGIVPASDTGAVEMAHVVAAGRARRRHAGLGKLRRGLGHRCGEAAEAQGRAQAAGALRRAARSRRGRFRPRRGLHLERHDLGRARAERRLDPGRPRGPDHLRRDLGGLRAGRSTWTSSMSSPSPGRRCWAARRAHGMLILSPARGRAARELHAALAAAEDLPPDQGRQADRRHLRGRDHQHALDAVRRGLPRRAELGGGHRRPDGADRARRRQRRRASHDWVDQTPLGREILARDPATRSNTSVCLTSPIRPQAPTSAGASPRRWSSCSRRKASAYDIGAYRDAPPGLRIWCGATVETSDVAALMPWLDWAYRPGRPPPDPRPQFPHLHIQEYHMAPRVLVSDKLCRNRRPDLPRPRRRGRLQARSRQGQGCAACRHRRL